MKVKKLKVGPILGETTANRVRLWGRAALEMTPSGPRRCFGVARIRKKGQASFGPPMFFKMNPNFDMTGVLVVENLKEGQVYEYQMGWFFADAEPADLKTTMPLIWKKANTAFFRTGVSDDGAERSFVVGSCRYLLRLLGGSFFDNRGDKTYKSIMEQVNGGVRTDAIIMTGDQIYADDLNVIGSDCSLEEFNRRYREAFSQKHIRRLMSSVPTYMTLDDHEIEDNWPSHSSERDLVVKYPNAMHAYLTYQMSHSPLHKTQGSRLAGPPDHFWYQFRDGCCDFFVTDVRTERNLTEDQEQRQIINSDQMTALKDWLLDKSGRIKFIVSSVPFFPDATSSSGDKWDGFPKQRTELIELVKKEKLKKVVFLSGDIHCSCTTTLTSTDDPDFKIVSIISSAFFWPYPHPKKDKYQLEGSLPGYKDAGPYEVSLVSSFQATDNFTRVHASHDELTIEIYSRKGMLLDKSRVAF